MSSFVPTRATAFSPPGCLYKPQPPSGGLLRSSAFRPALFPKHGLKSHKPRREPICRRLYRNDSQNTEDGILDRISSSVLLIRHTRFGEKTGIPKPMGCAGLNFHRPPLRSGCAGWFSPFPSGIFPPDARLGLSSAARALRGNWPPQSRRTKPRHDAPHKAGRIMAGRVLPECHVCPYSSASSIRTTEISAYRPGSLS